MEVIETQIIECLSSMRQIFLLDSEDVNENCPYSLVTIGCARSFTWLTTAMSYTSEALVQTVSERCLLSGPPGGHRGRPGLSLSLDPARGGGCSARLSSAWLGSARFFYHQRSASWTNATAERTCRGLVYAFNTELSEKLCSFGE